ncbi:MAG: DNA polymerase III subunit delta [Solirubrobacterales bacterium]
MPEEMQPAYLFAGDDEAKLAATRRRLRERAEGEGGPAALETFTGEGRAAPDADALVAAIAAMSLTALRRYLLADGVEAWGKSQAARVAEALAAIPEATTVVLIARGKAPAALAKAVKAAGGEVHAYEAPKAREMPKMLVAEAKRRGFSLAPDAARLIVERLGRSPLRLGNELDRLALWAGEDGEVMLADLEAMIADTSEAAAWSLADSVVEGDAAGALAVAERLVGQGESVTGLSYMLSSRLRAGARAAGELEAGRTEKQVADGLGMHPYAAKMLIKRLSGRSPEQLRGSVGAVADLELWCRGGSDYSEDVALTLALRRAAGGGG